MGTSLGFFVSLNDIIFVMGLKIWLGRNQVNWLGFWVRVKSELEILVFGQFLGLFWMGGK